MTKQLQSLRTTLAMDNDQFHQSSEQSKSDLKALRSEMNFVRASGREYQNSMEGLTKQQDILNRELKVQKQRLEEVKRKYDAAAKASGENSDEAKKLLSQYNNIASQARRTERKLESVTDAIDDQSNKWRTLSKRVDEAGDNLKEAGGKMVDFGSTMTASVTAPILGFGVAAVETTREFRLQIAKLETNAEDAGLSIETMNDAMRSLSGISDDTEANVEALSNLMATGANADQLQTAIEELSGAVIKFPETIKIEELSNSLQETIATSEATGQFAELLERLGVNVDKFNEGLKKAKKNGNELDYALGKLEDLNLSNVTEEFRKTNEELVEAREAQYDFKRSFAELGETLEPIATEITESITDIIEEFNDLDPAVQKNILKMAGLAAAVGPASVVLGGLTTTIGNVSKGVGGLSRLLGKSGGKKGLIGRLAFMAAKSGPIGLATVAAGGLAYAIYQLVDSDKELLNVSFDTAKSLKKQYDATAGLIDSYINLRDKSNLTNKEFEEYLILQARIQKETDPKVINELQEKMDDLQRNSGLSNREFDKMIGLNKKLVEKVPEATKKIEGQTEAIKAEVGALKKLNTKKALDAIREYQEQRAKAEINLNQLVQKREKIQSELNRGKQKENILYQALVKNSETFTKKLINEQIHQIDQLRIERSQTKQHSIRRSQLTNEILRHQKILSTLKDGRRAIASQLDETEKKNKKLQESINKANKELNKYQEATKQIKIMRLRMAGITQEKAKQLVQDGESLSYIQKQINQLRNEEDQLLENYNAGKLTRQEYHKQVEEIESQIGKLRETGGKIYELTSEARDYTSVLGEDVTKYINVIGDGLSYAHELNRELGENVYKSVFTDFYPDYHAGYAVPVGYATGTDHHPGGSFLAGEEGYELGRMGNRWDLLNFGLYNAPSGYQVFPHDESKRILNALNNMPGYADGARPVGETNRVVGQLNNPDPEVRVVYPSSMTLKIGQHEFLAEVVDDITEIQDRKKSQAMRAEGLT